MWALLKFEIAKPTFGVKVQACLVPAVLQVVEVGPNGLLQRFAVALGEILAALVKQVLQHLQCLGLELQRLQICLGRLPGGLAMLHQSRWIVRAKSEAALLVLAAAGE